MLRFDIAAPLLGFSAPAAIATMLAAIALLCARPSAWFLDTLSSKRTGAVVTRWLLPAALVVPVAVGWMRLYAEREGLFGEAFGMTLFTLVMIAWFSTLILWVARTGSSWREMPEEEFGKWQRAYRRYELWLKQGLWERILQTLGEEGLPGPTTKES